MTELIHGPDGPEHKEWRRLISEALQEDRDRTATRLIWERERQRTAEAEKSARLRELRLAQEAAEAQAKQEAQRAQVRSRLKARGQIR